MRGNVVALVLGFGFALGVASCGGSEGGPATPTAPAPTVAGLAITSSTDLMKINQSETFIVTATMSNGSTAVER
jgi:hypothetical protein